MLFFRAFTVFLAYEYIALLLNYTMLVLNAWKSAKYIHSGCCRSNTLSSDPAAQDKPFSQLSEIVFIRLWKTIEHHSTCARCSFICCAALIEWAHEPACAFSSPPSLPHYFSLSVISVLPLPLQIFMRYGRQRWKLKGKIETNSRQSWDGEEMIFMPLITDLISIKVQWKILHNRYPHKHLMWKIICLK